jgi:fucose permease
MEWRAIGLLAAVSFLYLGAEVGFGGWAFTYIRHVTGADSQTASFASAGFWLALSAGSMIAATRPRAVRGYHLVLACAALAALAAAGLLLLNSPTIAVVLAIAYGLFLGPIYPLNIAAAAAIVPRAAGLVTALIICSSQVGGGVLPWLQGYLLGWSDRLGASLTLTLCVSMAGVQLVFLRSRPLKQLPLQA